MNLGDWVKVDSVLHRTSEDVIKENKAKHLRFWKNTSTSVRTALVVGERTLYNGELIVEEGRCVMVNRKPFKAYLLVTNKYEKPFYVAAEDVLSHA